MARYRKSKFNALKDFVTVDGQYQRKDSVIGYWKFEDDVSELGSTADRSKTKANLTYTTSGRPSYSQQTPESRKYIQKNTALFNSSHGIIGNPSGNSLSFGNGATDKPFSISFWIKPVLKMDGNNNEYDIFLKMTAGGYEYAVYLYEESARPGQAKLTFKLYNAGGTTANANIFCSTESVTRDSRIRYDLDRDKWYNCTVTYDGSGAAAGLKTYVNAIENSTVGTGAGGYTAMNATASEITVGRHFTGASNYFSGNLSSIMMWDVCLSQSNITALYQAASGPYNAISGYLNDPYRVMLRNLDNRTGSYPGNLRTTGMSGGEKGNSAIAFRDQSTIVFSNKEQALYPIVLTQTEISQSGIHDLLSSPNMLPDIIAPGSSKPSISTDPLDRDFYNNHPYTPFEDSRVYLKDKNTSAFFASGTRHDVYPGFGSPVRDKYAIGIDISCGEEKVVSRYNTNGLPIDPLGIMTRRPYAPTDGAHTRPKTGFCYFNKDLRRWEDIGLSIISSASITDYRMWETVYEDFAYAHDGNRWRPAGMSRPNGSDGGQGIRYAGDVPKAYQFKMSDHMGSFAGTKNVLVNNFGYDKIGSPTRSGQAPYHKMYHASSSQTIQMSDYITAPFAVEKIVLQIPITAQTMLGSQAATGKKFHDSVRDIDNYTFFLYRQSRSGGNFDTDSREDVESSRRYLFASGCAAFYNSNAFSSSVSAEILTDGLPHTPAWSHDWDNNIFQGEQNIRHMSVFTGSIVVKMTPAVGNCQFLGGSRFPVKAAKLTPSAEGVQLGCGGIVISDFWEGGTTAASASLIGSSNWQVDVHYPLMPSGTHAADVADGSSPAATDGYAMSTGSIGMANSLVGNIRRFQPTLNSSPRSQNSPRYISGWPATYTKAVLRPEPYSSDARVPVSEIPDDRRPLRGFTGERTSRQTYIPYVSTSSWSRVYRTPDQQGILNYTANKGKLTFGDLPGSTESPYVLLPGDELVLGIDAGISMLPVSGTGTLWGPSKPDINYHGFTKFKNENEFFGCMSASFMQITTDTAKLTIFGSLIREDKELMFETNQNLTSDAIHESVGCDRVTDQYMVSTRREMSASYLDRWVAGVFTEEESLARDGFNRTNVWPPPRRVYGLFSKQVDASNLNRLSPYHWFRNYERGTWAPGYVGISLLSNFRADPFGVSSRNVQFVKSANIRSSQRFVSLVDKEERYYDSIMPKISSYMSNSLSLGRTLEPGYMSKLLYTFEPEAWGSADKRYAYGFPYAKNPPRQIVDKTFIKFVDREGGSNIFSAYTQRTVVNTTLFQKGWRWSGLSTIMTTDTSGSWCNLYGIKNVRREFTKAVFRSDRYGQFRDMLEQRRDTKLYLSKDLEKGISDSPVQVKFVKSSDGVTQVPPHETDSANFSTEYTSSIPYVDADQLSGLKVYLGLPTFVITKADFTAGTS
jgi:hypothetical protein